MSRAIHTLVLVAAVVLAGAAPCLTPIDGRAACPMAHCDQRPAESLAAPSCCCAPAGAQTSRSAAPAVIEALALAPHAAPPAPALVAVAAHAHGVPLPAPPDPVPLYLLHATLLI